jgi:hypothetical protein
MVLPDFIPVLFSESNRRILNNPLTFLGDVLQHARQRRKVMPECSYRASMLTINELLRPELWIPA